MSEAKWDYKEFQRVWNSASSVQEVAEYFGIPYPTAHMRAQFLRNVKGWYIKDMRGWK